MSYTVSLEYGPTDDPVSAWSGGYTMNVHPMWTAALGRPLYEIGGQTASDVAVDLGRAADTIRADDSLDEFAPPNHWGTRLGAAQFLEDIAVACRRFPDARVVVWR